MAPTGRAGRPCRDHPRLHMRIDAAWPHRRDRWCRRHPSLAVRAPGRDMRSDRGEGGGHCRTPRSQTSVPAGMRALCRLRPSRGRGCEVSACLPMAMTSRDVAHSCPCGSAAIPSPKRAPRGLGPGRASWRDRGPRGDASLPCVASRVRGRSAAGSTISVDGRPGNRIHVRSGCRCALCRRRTWMGPGNCGAAQAFFRVSVPHAAFVGVG